MWRSVPQMPVRSTRMRTSLMPIFGSGTSSSKRPVSAFLFTSAFMIQAIPRTIISLVHYTRSLSNIVNTSNAAARIASRRRLRLRSCPNGLSKQLDALGHGDVRIFFALEFERDVAGVARVIENFCDSIVIEIKGVPFAAAVISFGLCIDSFGRDPGELVIGVLHEVAGVHQSTQPRRRD